MSDTSNTAFLGQIVDTNLSLSVLSTPVEAVLANVGVVPDPLLIAGGNASAVSSIVLSQSQIAAMQYNPLVINNASATFVITLEPEDNSAGNTAAYILQQALNLTVAGQVAFLQLAQVGTQGIISLAGSTLTPVTTASDSLVLIKVAALVVGTSSTSTVTITSSPQAFGVSKVAVAQLTSNVTAVTANALCGVITSFGSFTNAANPAVAVSFTVNNSLVAIGSAVFVAVDSYGGTLGTNGYPVLTVSSVTTGSFVINVVNAGITNALAGALVIAFRVVV